MKTPKSPPDPAKLLGRPSEADPERLLRVFRLLAAGAGTAPYVPWDKLRFKSPPDGFTHEEWWFAVKLARRGLQRPLPLQDVEGRPFTYALPDEVLPAVEEVNKDARGHIGISEEVTNPASRDRYLVNSLIEESITSSQLEGAATTHRVAKEMLRAGRPPRTHGERMILNNYHAMRRIRELQDRPLTSELIREVHRIVTDGTLDDPQAAGRFQQPGERRVTIQYYTGNVLHTPPPAEMLPDMVERLCDFANGDADVTYVPSVVRAITIHFMLAYTHPFADGNGRTARALFYWSMLRQGYWLTEFLSISRILKNAPAKYARSFLHTEQDENDLTYFVIYQLGVIKRAIGELHSYLERKAAELRALRGSLALMPGEFNHRQLALLEHALKHPGTGYTAQSHAGSHNVSRETARQDLMDLERRGLLTRTKIGRRFGWVPPDDLAKRVER